MSSSRPGAASAATTFIRACWWTASFFWARRSMTWSPTSSSRSCLFLQMTDPKKDIHLYINSPGGSVTAGLAIYDTMQFLTCDVNTYCIGQAASMGAVLLCGGTKGKRYALPNANIMIHQVLGGAEGQASDVEIRVKYMLKLKQRLNDDHLQAYRQTDRAGGEGLRPRQFHEPRRSQGLRPRG